MRSLRPLRLCLTVMSVAVTAACGGGTNSSGSTTTDGPIKASVHEGPITGFGSVMVNGVRFKDSAARVVDEDGVRVARADLRLGTMVRVEGSADDAAGTGEAGSVTVMPEVRGRVESVDAAGSKLVVMGQNVTVNAETVFEGTTGLAALRAGDMVEVHGTAAADGTILATLIEKKMAPAVFVVRGAVSGYDAAAKTFKIGALTVRFGAAQLMPANAVIADGMRVRVAAAAAPVGNVLEATRVKVRNARAAFPEAAGFVSIKGVVDVAPDAAGKLTVSGIVVDSSAAKVEGALMAGSRVQVRGSFEGEILKATKIETEGRRDMAEGRNRLIGTVSAIAEDKTFTVNGVKVDASKARFDRGSLQTLSVGNFVIVRGGTQTGATGTVLMAERVTIADRSSDDAGEQPAAAREIYGAITDFASAASFKVNDIKIDASKAKFEDGVSADLANGRFVEIKGALADGVFVATEVEFKRARMNPTPAPVPESMPAPTPAPLPAPAPTQN